MISKKIGMITIGQSPRPDVVTEIKEILGGEIEVARYAPSGTLELAGNAVTALGERNAVMLSNHGAVGVGRSMREALNACEVLEKAARIYLLTLALGKAAPLPVDAVSAARSLFLRLQNSEDL